MRRIVTFNWVTADGYFAAADGNLDWVVPDEEQAKAAAKDISNIDTSCLGVGLMKSSKSSGRLLLSPPMEQFPTPMTRPDDLRSTAQLPSGSTE